MSDEVQKPARKDIEEGARHHMRRALHAGSPKSWYGFTGMASVPIVI